MKKTLAMLVVLVLLSSLAFAAAGEKGAGAAADPEEMRESGQGTGQGEQVQVEERLQEGEMAQQQGGEQAQEKQQTGEMMREQRGTGSPQGLEMAMSQVQNENARQRLEQNIERFQQNYQARMERMEGLEVEEVDEETGAVTLKAKEQVRFLGFIKGKATKRFEIDNNGNINEKQPWYRFLYAEESSE